MNNNTIVGVSTLTPPQQRGNEEGPTPTGALSLGDMLNVLTQQQEEVPPNKHSMRNSLAHQFSVNTEALSAFGHKNNYLLLYRKIIDERSSLYEEASIIATAWADGKNTQALETEFQDHKRQVLRQLHSFNNLVRRRQPNLMIDANVPSLREFKDMKMKQRQKHPTTRRLF